MDTADEKRDLQSTQHVTDVEDDIQKGPVVKEAAVHSVALAAAVEAHKPNLWSRGMVQLYMIMSIGYLVSSKSTQRFESWNKAESA